MKTVTALTSAATLLGVTLTSTAWAVDTTLLLDFQGTVFSSGRVPADATNADFSGNDSNIDGAASVVIINSLGDNIHDTTSTDLSSGSGISADVTFASSSGTLQGFTAAGGATYGGNALLGDYFFLGGGAGGTITTTISSIEEIDLGDTITLTVYGAGDQDDQEVEIAVTQGATAIGTFITEADGNPQPFAQFTFANNGSDITIVSTNQSNFGAINGLSLTSTVPEPASLALLGGGLMAVTSRRRRRRA